MGDMMLKDKDKSTIAKINWNILIDNSMGGVEIDITLNWETKEEVKSHTTGIILKITIITRLHCQKPLIQSMSLINKHQI
jgi:hypothetical protein